MNSHTGDLRRGLLTRCPAGENKQQRSIREGNKPATWGETCFCVTSRAVPAEHPEAVPSPAAWGLYIPWGFLKEPAWKFHARLPDGQPCYLYSHINVRKINSPLVARSELGKKPDPLLSDAGGQAPAQAPSSEGTAAEKRGAGGRDQA